MVTYSQILNKQKKAGNKEWLTPSQLEVFHQIEKKFRNQRIINIFGTEGVGKTFLGWVMEKEGIGKYYTDQESLSDSNPKIVIIDNFPSDRNAHRRFRSGMSNIGINKAILLSRHAIPDDVPAILLRFSNEDSKKFKHICYDKFRLQIRDEKDGYNMHDLIKKNLWEEVE